MKTIIVVAVFLFMLLLSNCKKYTQDTITATCNWQPSNPSWPLGDTLQKLVNQYAGQGIPGLVLMVYSPSIGYWGTSSGYAKIETKTPMELCHYQYLQSATKMYMAVAILRLQEAGLLDINAPITNYLPANFSKYIDNAASMNVRHLLNHTSGMPDYLDNPAYVEYALQHPDHYFSSDELLGYIKNKKQRFTPDTQFEYSNTNFHVLALIADAIMGDHNELIRKGVLEPLSLTNTYYRNITGQPQLVNSYLDRFSNGIVENVSQLQQTSISFSKGDDGIVATPLDAINFLRGLMEGKLLTTGSLNQLLTFVNGKDGAPVYGLGIYHVTYSGFPGYGHGGSGAGSGCGLYYFPDKKIYVFMGTNIGTLVDGPITQRALDAKNELLRVILQS